MSNYIEVTANVTLTGEQIAAAFWDLCSREQADFFAALDRMAGVNLCFQMASVVDEIRQRSERGDTGAVNGFRTMLAHAEAYAESANDIRSWAARREIDSMAKRAKEGAA